MTDTQKVDREDFGFRGRIQPAQVLTTASLEGLLQIVWKSLSAVKTLGQSLSLPSSTRSNSPLLAPAGSCQRPARARPAWAGSVERSWENSRLEGLPPELPGGRGGTGAGRSTSERLAQSTQCGRSLPRVSVGGLRLQERSWEPVEERLCGEGFILGWVLCRAGNSHLQR